jgi:hypothetical protein
MSSIVCDTPRSPYFRRAKNHNNRARRAGLPATLTPADFAHAVAHFHHACAYCGSTRPPLTLDCFIPFARPHSPGCVPTNIVPACLRCNERKGVEHPARWLLLAFGEVHAALVLSRIYTWFRSLSDPVRILMPQPAPLTTVNPFPDTFRAFTQFTRAWYADRVPLLDGAVEEFFFGYYYKDGSTAGSACMQWHRIGDQAVPLISAHDDAWRALAAMPDVLTALAERNDQGMNPLQFRELLLALSFEDITATQSPYDSRASS